VRPHRSLAALIVLATGFLPAAEAAGGPAAFEVTGGPPGAVTLQPGVTSQYTFRVTNRASAPATITTNVTGLFFDGDTPQFSGTPSPGLTATASPTRLALAAGAAQDVKVSLTAHPGVPAGGLYAGVVFSNAPPSHSGTVSVVTSQARPLIGHVPGAYTDTGRISGFEQMTPKGSSGSNLTLLASFIDTGNIDYEVTGEITLLSSSGVMGSVPVGPRLVLPGNTRTFPITFAPSGPPPGGPYTAKLHLIWGQTAERKGDASAPVSLTNAGPTGSTNPPAGQGTLPSTFIGAPLTHHSQSSTPHHRVSGGAWILRGVDLLLLLLVLALLLVALMRHRDPEEEAARQP
jgi:hypothetical protein